MKVLINLLKFIFIIILTICLISISLITIASATIFDKNYVIQKLEETDFYSETYNLVEANFENYIYQSGLDEDVLKNICTQEKVKNDINIILSNIYDGKKQTIDTTEIADNLNANIDKIGIKNKQNENAINQFVKHICDEYTSTVLHTKYENKINNIYIKAVNVLNKVYNVTSIVAMIDLVAIIIINNKKVLKDIQHFGIALLATGAFELAGCQIIVSKVNVQAIKIFNDSFSKTLVTILQDIIRKETSLGLGILVVAIFFIAIYVSIMVNKKTKENLNTGKEI